jgi:hypothetical protein
MATRNKTKPTIVDVPFVETMEQQAPTFFERTCADLGLDPALGWKRVLVSTVISMLASAGAGYILGTLTGYMALGALMLSGSAFIALMVYVLGIVVSFYAGYRIGPLVYLACVDKRVDSAFATARGWFTSAPQGATA